MNEEKTWISKIPRWVRWTLFLLIAAAILVPLGILLFGFARGRDVIIVKPSVEKITTTNKELRDEKGSVIATADVDTAVNIGKSILKKLEL